MLPAISQKRSIHIIIDCVNQSDFLVVDQWYALHYRLLQSSKWLQAKQPAQSKYLS